MAPYILGNHEISGGKVTATYIDEAGKPTEKLCEAKIFETRSDVDKYVAQKDIEVNAILVKEETNGSLECYF